MSDEQKKNSAVTPESLRRLVILLGVLVIVGVVVFGVWKHFSTRSTDVYFVNGLEIPLVVKLGDRTVKVKPMEASRERNVVHGQYTVVAATESGRVVDEFSVVIPRRTDVVAINPMGAAPMFAEQLIYYREGQVPLDASRDEAPPVIHYFGLRLVVRENVAFPFRPPSANVRMSDTDAREKVWAFNLSPGGWRRSVHELLSRSRLKEASDIARQTAMADPNADEAVTMAAGLHAQVNGNPAAVEWCQSLVAKFPEAVEAHRNLQTFMQLARRTEECLATYRKLHEQNPDSPMFAYLRARMEPPAQATALLAQLVEKFPDYSYGRRAYGWQLYQSRQFVEAVAQFEKSQALDPQRHVDMLFNHARSLAALGRASDAVTLMVHYTDKLQMAMNFNAVVFYARLLQLAGDKQPPHTPEFYLQQQFGEKIPRDVLVWLACLLGASEIGEERLAELGTTALRTAADFTIAARRDPDLALKLAEAATSQAWEHIEDMPTLLIACELVMRGEKVKAIQLLDKLRQRISQDVALKKFIFDNEESPELAERDLETQAVLNFIRGRRAQLRGESADKFFDQALKDDVLQILIPHLIKNWKPAPQPKETPPAEKP